MTRVIIHMLIDVESVFCLWFCYYPIHNMSSCVGIEVIYGNTNNTK